MDEVLVANLHSRLLENQEVVVLPQPAGRSARILSMAASPKRITLNEPDLVGSYELVERRPDGSLLLRPERERLSVVLRETEGQVFRDEEFAAHLQRIAASEDDLPADLLA